MARRAPYGETAPVEGRAERLFNAVVGCNLFGVGGAALSWALWLRGFADLISNP